MISRTKNKTKQRRRSFTVLRHPPWKQRVQDCAAAHSDGFQELAKEQSFIHLPFNATLAICSVRESVPVAAAQGRWAAPQDGSAAT